MVSLCTEYWFYLCDLVRCGYRIQVIHSAPFIQCGAGECNLDASLLKNFHFTETAYVQLLFETFNTLNHPVFAAPARFERNRQQLRLHHCRSCQQSTPPDPARSPHRLLTRTNPKKPENPATWLGFSMQEVSGVPKTYSSSSEWNAYFPSGCASRSARRGELPNCRPIIHNSPSLPAQGSMSDSAYSQQLRIPHSPNRAWEPISELSDTTTL